MFPEEIKRVSISNLLPQTSYVIQVTGNVREGELLFKTQPGAVNCTTSENLMILAVFFIYEYVQYISYFHKTWLLRHFASSRLSKKVFF